MVDWWSRIVSSSSSVRFSSCWWRASLRSTSRKKERRSVKVSFYVIQASTSGRTYLLLQLLPRLDMVLLELVVKILESFQILDGDSVLFELLRQY